jgi:Spy/CpxP family protein refolding chaperone
MKRTLLTLAATGAIAAGLIFAQAPAQQAPSQPNQSKPLAAHRANARHRMFQELNLTAAQKQQAKAIFQQAREAAKPVREQLKQNRLAMSAAVKANDKAQIEQLSAQRAPLMAKATAGRNEAMAKFYSTLTPQQRAKAERLHQRFEGRMRQRTAQRTNG